MRTCERCDAKLSLGRRLGGTALCENCEHETAVKRDKGLRKLKRDLDPLSKGPVAAVQARNELFDLQVEPELDAKQVRDAKLQAISGLLDSLMVDGRFEYWHAVVLNAVGEPLGLCKDFQWNVPSIESRTWVGRFKAGDPPLMDWSDVLVREQGEVLYWKCPAAKLKKETIREIELRQDGASIEMSGRLRVEKGTLKGREVEVGSQLVVEDDGEIFVTSHRAVFVGKSSSAEYRGGKIIGTKQFRDGVQIRTTGGDEPLFRLDDANWSAISAASIEFMMSQVRGTAPHRNDEDVPDFPELDVESEKKIQNAVQNLDLPEFRVRLARLTGHAGLDPFLGIPQEATLEPAPSPKADDPSRPVEGGAIAGNGGESCTPQNCDFRITRRIWLDTSSTSVSPIGKFLQVDFEVRSLLDRPEVVSASEFQLAERDGTRYSPWTAGASDTSFFRRHLENVFVIETLQPKLWYRGTLVYDLPDEEIDLVRYFLPSKLS